MKTKSKYAALHSQSVPIGVKIFLKTGGRMTSENQLRREGASMLPWLRPLQKITRLGSHVAT
jgi:hypothetical protein